MVYEIIWAESASRELGKLDRVLARRLLEQVERLREAPKRSLRRLVGVPYYRLRVGDYRLIVEVIEERLVILVLKLGHRRTVY